MNTTRWNYALILLCLCLALLGGCGQKGDLYLPDEEKPAAEKPTPRP